MSDENISSEDDTPDTNDFDVMLVQDMTEDQFTYLENVSNMVRKKKFYKEKSNYDLS